MQANANWSEIRNLVHVELGSLFFFFLVWMITEGAVWETGREVFDSVRKFQSIRDLGSDNRSQDGNYQNAPGVPGFGFCTSIFCHLFI